MTRRLILVGEAFSMPLVGCVDIVAAAAIAGPDLTAPIDPGQRVDMIEARPEPILEPLDIRHEPRRPRRDWEQRERKRRRK